MRFGAQITALSVKRATWVFVVASLFLSFGVFHTVQAEGTSVQASVNSGTLHPALELSGINSPVTVDAMPLHLAGTVDSLTQIQVYVDGEYSVAIPLDAGATSFSYDLVIPAGSHAVKLVGISPFADISPTVELSVTYVPPTQQSVGGGSTPDGSSPTATGGGVVISRDATSNASTTYVAPVEKSSLPTWVYNGLVAVNLLRKDDVNGTELTKTMQRFSLAATGMFLFVFARLAFLLYHRVRYSWLGFRKRPVPRFLHRHPLGYIRVLGAILITSVFSLI